MSAKPSDKPAPYYRVDITRYPALPVDAELALFVDYRRRRTASKREKIVNQYLYWAAELACRYCGPRMAKAEAISAANYGLMLAIEKFDPTQGKRFVTYSYFLIRREVLYALRDSYGVNPESGLWAAKYQYKKSAQTAEDEEKYLKERREVFDNVGTLTSIGSQADGEGAADYLGDQFLEDDCRKEVEQSSLLSALREALPSLPAELRQVVELKYFNNGSPLSFVDIGVRLGCAADHARWLHARAMQVLQKKLRPLKKEL